MLFRQIRADGQEAFGMVEIAIAAGGAVCAKRAFVAGDGGGHAEGGISVIVVRADDAANQLSQRIKLFGIDLACGDHGEGVSALGGLNPANFGGGFIEGLIPGGLTKRLKSLFSEQRGGAAVGGVKQLEL